MLPRKVLGVAHQLGVHNDCLISSPCTACSAKINQAFEHFYGHLTTTPEVEFAIMQDFRQDIIEEESD